MAVNVGGSRRERAGAARAGRDHASTATVVLQPSASSPARAREFLRTVLADCDEQTLEVLAVLTSELVTNAVLHAGTTIRMTVRRRASRIRVEVSDDSTDQPALRSPTSDESFGRGLLIVSALAERWGVDPLDGGKRVWAEVSTESENADVSVP